MILLGFSPKRHPFRANNLKTDVYRIVGNNFNPVERFKSFKVAFNEVKTVLKGYDFQDDKF
ncbi:hypothetical protein J2Z22_004787 [Paenibacillus forsythiae]|uniref:Uncharacterized protein n=1 Tax=Paenibacillus forsythiae TaxID=365616 RepID=A0ABU3HEE4_9BACL|nr:hypothetical protein [Paenibacillus forsythiae]